MRRSCTVVEELYGGTHQAEDALLNQTGRIRRTVWTMGGLWFEGSCSVPVTHDKAFQCCIRVVLENNLLWRFLSRRILIIPEKHKVLQARKPSWSACLAAIEPHETPRLGGAWARGPIDDQNGKVGDEKP